MKIDFANLQLQYQKYKVEIDKKIQSVLNKSNYIMGEEINFLEENLKKFTGASHAITCSSGTDALLLSMMAIEIQPGDEVITTPFTWVSTAETIALLNAKPVFVDIDIDTYNIDVNLIESAITEKTKAIIPVNLFGQPSDITEIQSIADKYKLKIIVDGAQSFGSTYQNKIDSTLGHISITSFFPSKPFGCYGDGGAVFTNDEDLAYRIKMLRIHGQNKRNYHKFIGLGGRMDTIQAAILLAKFPYFKNELVDRQNVANSYNNKLSKIIKTPIIKSDRTSAWAQYTVRVINRNLIQENLKKKNIPTSIFYPLPLHLQVCFEYLKYKKGDFPVAEKCSDEVFSLPMNPFLTSDQIDYIISSLNEAIK